jgi:hypothetical protein
MVLRSRELGRWADAKWRDRASAAQPLQTKGGRSTASCEFCAPARYGATGPSDTAAEAAPLACAHIPVGEIFLAWPRRGIRTKINGRRDGQKSGGIRFGVGPLAHLLKNRFYIREVAYRGDVHRGEHEPILTRGGTRKTRRQCHCPGSSGSEAPPMLECGRT